MAAAREDADRLLPRWLLLGNLLAAVMVAGLAWYVLAASLSAYRARALEAADNLARGLQQAIGADVARVDIVLQTVVADHERDLADGHPEPGRLGRMLAQQRPLLPGLDGLRVADPQGRLVHGAGAAEGREVVVAAQDYFARAAGPGAAGPVVSEPHRSPVDDRWVVVVARPLAGAGIVFAELPVQHFQSRLSAVTLGPQDAVSLRSATLRLVARHAPQGDPAAGLGSSNVSPQLRAALDARPDAGHYLARTALDNVERANAYRRVEGLPLLVIVGRGTGELLLPWYREAAVVAGLGALALAALGLSSIVAVRAWRRERASREALAREAQVQLAFMQTASDGIHVLDRDGRVVQCSESFAAMLGHEPADMPGMPHAQWDPRYLEPQMIERFRAFEVGARYRFNTRHRRKDGSWYDAEVVSVGVRIGARDYLYCAARDITQREAALRALRASESLLDRTGRVARVGGWELDLRNGQATWSAQTRRLLEVDDDFKADVEAGMAFFEPEVRPLVRNAVQAAIADSRPWDLELPLVTARGRRLWVRSVGEPESEGGRVVRLVGALQDVTESLQRAAELQRERAMRAQTERHAAELDALLKERSEMLDVMAHEVRQPLNNASAALQSLGKALPEAADDATAQRLRRAQNVMGQVLASIDNTLAAAALLARTDPIQREDTDIDTLIAVAIGDMPAADRSRIWLRRETTARTASMDMSLMRLALRNLLSNALKYSPPGEPVRMTLAETEDPLGIVIDVGDAGPGVDEALLPRLFERGVRNPHPGAPPGHGLGLYIVRRVMELHGGRVTLLHNGPDGATFRLELLEAPDEA